MRTPEENKALCEKYPFLKCDDTYKSTWADDMPQGWWNAFGEMMCDEIKSELIRCNYLAEYRVEQVKEKFGALRWYDDGIPEGCKVWDIISKYSVLSENICVVCSKPDVPMMSWGWCMPMCYNCATNKDEYAECSKKQDPHRMEDYRRWSQYSSDGEWVKHEEYIGDTAERIRRTYADRNNG